MAQLPEEKEYEENKGQNEEICFNKYLAFMNKYDPYFVEKDLTTIKAEYGVESREYTKIYIVDKKPKLEVMSKACLYLCQEIDNNKLLTTIYYKSGGGVVNKSTYDFKLINDVETNRKKDSNGDYCENKQLIDALIDILKIKENLYDDPTDTGVHLSVYNIDLIKAYILNSLLKKGIDDYDIIEILFNSNKSHYYQFITSLYDNSKENINNLSKANYSTYFPFIKEILNFIDTKNTHKETFIVSQGDINNPLESHIVAVTLEYKINKLYITIHETVGDANDNNNHQTLALWKKTLQTILGEKYYSVINVAIEIDKNNIQSDANCSINATFNQIKETIKNNKKKEIPVIDYSIVTEVRKAISDSLTNQPINIDILNPDHKQHHADICARFDKSNNSSKNNIKIEENVGENKFKEKQAEVNKEIKEENKKKYDISLDENRKNYAATITKKLQNPFYKNIFYDPKSYDKFEKEQYGNSYDYRPNQVKQDAKDEKAEENKNLSLSASTKEQVQNKDNNLNNNIKKDEKNNKNIINQARIINNVEDLRGLGSGIICVKLSIDNNYNSVIHYTDDKNIKKICKKLTTDEFNLIKKIFNSYPNNSYINNSNTIKEILIIFGAQSMFTVANNENNNANDNKNELDLADKKPIENQQILIKKFSPPPQDINQNENNINSLSNNKNTINKIICLSSSNKIENLEDGNIYLIFDGGKDIESKIYYKYNGTRVEKYIKLEKYQYKKILEIYNSQTIELDEVNNCICTTKLQDIKEIIEIFGVGAEITANTTENNNSNDNDNENISDVNDSKSESEDNNHDAEEKKSFVSDVIPNDMQDINNNNNLNHEKSIFKQTVEIYPKILENELIAISQPCYIYENNKVDNSKNDEKIANPIPQIIFLPKDQEFPKFHDSHNIYIIENNDKNNDKNLDLYYRNRNEGHLYKKNITIRQDYYNKFFNKNVIGSDVSKRDEKLVIEIIKIFQLEAEFSVSNNKNNNSDENNRLSDNDLKSNKESAPLNNISLLNQNNNAAINADNIKGICFFKQEGKPQHQDILKQHVYLGSCKKIDDNNLELVAYYKINENICETSIIVNKISQNYIFKIVQFEMSHNGSSGIKIAQKFVKDIITCINNTQENKAKNNEKNINNDNNNNNIVNQIEQKQVHTKENKNEQNNVNDEKEQNNDGNGNNNDGNENNNENNDNNDDDNGNNNDGNENNENNDNNDDDNGNNNQKKDNYFNSNKIGKSNLLNESQQYTTKDNQQDINKQKDTALTKTDNILLSSIVLLFNLCFRPQVLLAKYPSTGAHVLFRVFNLLIWASVFFFAFPPLITMLGGSFNFLPFTIKTVLVNTVTIHAANLFLGGAGFIVAGVIQLFSRCKNPPELVNQENFRIQPSQGSFNSNQNKQRKENQLLILIPNNNNQGIDNNKKNIFNLNKQ